MAKKDDVLKVLDDEDHKSTNEVRKELGVNWYTASKLLTELWADDDIEKLQLKDSSRWKLKREDGEYE